MGTRKIDKVAIWAVILFAVVNVITAISLTSNWDLFSLGIFIYGMAPYLVAGIVALTNDQSTKKAKWAIRNGISAIGIVDCGLRIQITYFPGSSTDCLAVLTLPLVTFGIGVIAFGITYLWMHIIEKSSKKV